MPKPNSDFKNLISAYMLANSDPATPYAEGIPLTCLYCASSGSWRVSFRSEGESFSIYISSEELLGWMWSKINATLTS